MHQDVTSPKTTSSQPEPKCENRTTDAAHAGNSVTTDRTENAQHCQQTPLATGSEGQQPRSRVEELHGTQPNPTPASCGTSEKKKAANRLNSGNSTGPKTPAGKANSRRNARKHCLLAEKALFDSKGMPQDEGYHALYFQLLEEYPGDDLITQLRREALLAAYWRNVQSLRYERDLMERNGANAFQAFAMPNLHRYSVANQKALAARLQELEDTPSALLQSEVESPAEDANEVTDRSADVAAPTEEYENHDSSTDVTSGSTDSAPVDSGLGGSARTDSALPSSAVEEVAPTAERENESLDQTAKPGPPQNGDAAIPAPWQMSGKAESEDESGAAQSSVIQ